MKARWAVPAVAVGIALWLGTPNPIVIRHDGGGPIQARLEMMKTLRRPVRIDGWCASSCTLLLSVACVTPRSRLGFHGPTSQWAGINLAPDDYRKWVAVMAGHYPPALRAWYLAGPAGVFGRTVDISGATAIRLGARKC